MQQCRYFYLINKPPSTSGYEILLSACCETVAIINIQSICVTSYTHVGGGRKFCLGRLRINLNHSIQCTELRILHHRSTCTPSLCHVCTKMLSFIMCIQHCIQHFIQNWDFLTKSPSIFLRKFKFCVFLVAILLPFALDPYKETSVV